MTIGHPRFREITRELWAQDVIPDFREPDGIRLGLSPLSTSFAEVEAALMMGASGRQITWGVLVREALPILIQSATVTIITLLGYSAMAGAVGGGGVGDLAIQYGYQRNQVDVMVITVVVIVAIVGVIQLVGDMLSRLVDHR